MTTLDDLLASAAEDLRHVALIPRATTGPYPPRRWALAWAVAGIAAAAAVLVSAVIRDTGQPHPIERLPTATPVASSSTTTAALSSTTTMPASPATCDATFVGDSVTLGAAGSLQARGIVVDAAESRQAGEAVAVIDQLAANGALRPTVVLHVGTNGSVSAETLDRIMEALAETPTVVVLTVHADRAWTAPNNELLAALPSRYPSVAVLDWDALSADHPLWFYSDGIHLREEGAEAYAAAVIAAACG